MAVMFRLSDILLAMLLESVIVQITAWKANLRIAQGNALGKDANNLFALQGPKPKPIGITIAQDTFDHVDKSFAVYQKKSVSLQRFWLFNLWYHCHNKTDIKT